MARLPINPTRMELLRLKKRLAVALRGHKLLKDKLDGLMKEFLEISKKYKISRLKVDEQLPKILKLFVISDITSSRQITENALESTKQELELKINRNRIMGVMVPKLEFSFGEIKGMYSLIHTSPELDRAIASLKDFLPELLEMVELEETTRLMAGEIEKTKRRVNALEYSVIPRMQETVKYITNKLDEMERSNTARLMKIKSLRLAKES